MSRALVVPIVALIALAVSPSAAAASSSCTDGLGANPDAETLYNAGVCLEQDGAIGAAIRLYEELLRRHPKHALVPKAMIRQGNLYAAITFFARAAERYDEYSRRYAGERDAPNALRTAIELYEGVGDVRSALDGVHRFVKLYGRKRAGEAAEVFFWAAAIHREAGDDALVAHMQRYLKQFGSRGGRDRAAIAHATIGEILWRRSCPLGDGGVAGTCRKLARRARQARSCDPAVLPTTRVRRDPALVLQARDHLSKAVRVWRPPPRPTSFREAAAAEWRTLAELTLLEGDLEDYLDDAFPRGLDFDPEKRALQRRSVERFTAWLGRKQTQARSLHQSYVEIARRPSRHAAAAAQRIAVLSRFLRDELMGAEIPRNVRRGPYAADLEKAYCGALDDHSNPLSAAAKAALEHCVARPGWSRWHRLCAADLSALAPREHPPARERHGAAIHVGPVLDTAGAVR